MRGVLPGLVSTSRLGKTMRLTQRQKLVYLIEARPDAGAAALKPGQIVDVDLAR